VFSCPECGGTLWQTEDQQVLQFRCHVGHRYYAETLLAEQSEELEAALWTAIRIFKDKAVLARQMAARARATSDDKTAERYDDQAAVAAQYAEAIHQLILKGAATTPPGRGAEGPDGLEKPAG